MLQHNPLKVYFVPALVMLAAKSSVVRHLKTLGKQGNQTKIMCVCVCASVQKCTKKHNNSLINIFV